MVATLVEENRLAINSAIVGRFRETAAAFLGRGEVGRLVLIAVATDAVVETVELNAEPTTVIG